PAIRPRTLPNSTPPGEGVASRHAWVSSRDAASLSRRSFPLLFADSLRRIWCNQRRLLHAVRRPDLGARFGQRGAVSSRHRRQQRSHHRCNHAQHRHRRFVGARRRRSGLFHGVRAKRIRARHQRVSLRADPLNRLRRFASATFVLCAAASALAQGTEDTRTQYPQVLQNSYISINVGLIDQPFSQVQLRPGFQAASIEVPRVDVRVMLVGHEFNRFISAQASYMRPLNYVRYAGVRAGDAERHHVRVNFGGITLKARAPVAPRWSAYGEGGLGFTSRTGFALGETPVVTDAHYASVLVGGG